MDLGKSNCENLDKLGHCLCFWHLGVSLVNHRGVGIYYSPPFLHHVQHIIVDSWGSLDKLYLWPSELDRRRPAFLVRWNFDIPSPCQCSSFRRLNWGDLRRYVTFFDSFSIISLVCNLQAHRSLLLVACQLTRCHNQSPSASTVALQIIRHAHLHRTSNGINLRHCLRAHISSRWITWMKRLSITLRSPSVRILPYQEKRLSSTTTTLRLFTILVAGYELRKDSSQEGTCWLGFLFEVVLIDVQHQEIRLPSDFLVSFILLSMVLGMTLRIRHVCSSLWTVRMGKHRYSRCDVHNRRWNLHGGILPCHHELHRICQRRSDSSQLPIRFLW